MDNVKKIRQCFFEAPRALELKRLTASVFMLKIVCKRPSEIVAQS